MLMRVFIGDFPDCGWGRRGIAFVMKERVDISCLDCSQLIEVRELPLHLSLGPLNLA